MKTTLELYGQYLLNTQINYTCTNLADHVDCLSHDSVHRFLKGSTLQPSMVWDRVKGQVVYSPEGCVLFDDRQPGSLAAREKAADVRGAFIAHLAGYRIVNIVPVLIERLYAAYPQQGQSAAYPSETERRRTTIEVQGLVDTLIQVFDAANYLLATGQSDMAAVCYDHVLQTCRSPEIWNNLGIACALEALRLPGGDDFAYPFELDWQLRLSRPRGPVPTEEQERQRWAWLQRSQAAFAEALRLAPGRFSVQVNAWCVGVAAGEAVEVQRELSVFSPTKKMSRSEEASADKLSLLRALAAARAGDVAGAGQRSVKNDEL